MEPKPQKKVMIDLRAGLVVIEGVRFIREDLAGGFPARCVRVAPIYNASGNNYLDFRVETMPGQKIKPNDILRIGVELTAKGRAK